MGVEFHLVKIEPPCKQVILRQASPRDLESAGEYLCGLLPNALQFPPK